MASADVQKLAERIARLLDSESTNYDFATLFGAIEKINHRLDKLEAPQPTQHSVVRTSHLNHPSLDKCSVAEAVADDMINAKSKEKTCTFEPNVRPCDHCSMCSSRGF